MVVTVEEIIETKKTVIKESSADVNVENTSLIVKKTENVENDTSDWIVVPSVKEEDLIKELKLWIKSKKIPIRDIQDMKRWLQHIDNIVFQASPYLLQQQTVEKQPTYSSTRNFLSAVQSFQGITSTIYFTLYAIYSVSGVLAFCVTLYQNKKWIKILLQITNLIL